jgi:hypothetical protein
MFQSWKALQDHLKKTHIKNVFVLTWMDGGLVGQGFVDVRGGGGAGISPTIFLQDLPFYRFSFLNTYIYETKRMKDAYFEAPR